MKSVNKHVLRKQSSAVQSQFGELPELLLQAIRCARHRVALFSLRFPRCASLRPAAECLAVANYSLCLPPCCCVPVRVAKIKSVNKHVLRKQTSAVHIQFGELPELLLQLNTSLFYSSLFFIGHRALFQTTAFSNLRRTWFPLPTTRCACHTLLMRSSAHRASQCTEKASAATWGIVANSPVM